MNEHTSLEKIYISHFIWKGCERVAKGLYVRGELETEQTATYWPQVPLTKAARLSHSTGLLNRGSWGPKPSTGSWFSLPRTATRTPTNWLQLTQTVCGTGLYNCLTPTCFLWRRNCTEFNLSTVKVIPWYLRPDAPVIYTGASLNWQLGWDQYVTLPTGIESWQYYQILFASVYNKLWLKQPRWVLHFE